MNLSYTVLTILSLIIFAGLSYLVYKIYKKKKGGETFIEVEPPSVFDGLGENDASTAINEHFVFPETNKVMSEKTMNKFKTEEKEDDNKEESEDKKTEKKTKHHHEEKKREKHHPANELERLKKDYEGDSSTKERGFEFNLTEGILSHEILRKKDNGKSHH